MSDLIYGDSDGDLIISWLDGHIHFKTDRFSIGDLKRDIGQVDNISIAYTFVPMLQGNKCK